MNLADIAEALSGIESARKIVICAPGKKLEIETLILRYGMDHLWTVQESRHCSPDVVYLINESVTRL